MIKKRRDMAEWILDFFRRAKVDTNQIIMFRVVQNRLYDLNPKEKELFYSVFNELIKNGYFTYEEGSPQCLRLTKKGHDYIYAPNSLLDCCYDQRKASRKNYLDIINLGIDVASFGIQQNEFEDCKKESYNLFKLVCSLIMDVDDSELLGLIDKQIVLITEVVKSHQDQNKHLDDDAVTIIDTHIYMASIRLEYFGKKEMLQHLQYLHNLLLD